MHQLFHIAESITGLSLKLWAWTTASILGVSLGLGFDWMHHHVGLYIWSPQLTYYAVLALLIADAFTGSYYAWRKDKFETRKALNGIVKLIAYTFLLSTAHNISQGEEFYSWLPEAVLGPLIIITLLSLLKNLSLLGWVDNAFVKLIYKKVDKYKNPES